MNWLTPGNTGGMGRLGTIWHFARKFLVVMAIIYVMWAIGHFWLIPAWKPGPDPYSWILGAGTKTPEWLTGAIQLLGLTSLMLLAVIAILSWFWARMCGLWAWVRA